MPKMNGGFFWNKLGVFLKERKVIIERREEEEDAYKWC